ncbi:MAG: septum formation initiator family protein [Acidobacteria bacterium]|nr:septum formation initiator family protein [Acidobacteriota bacterium]
MTVTTEIAPKFVTWRKSLNHVDDSPSAELRRQKRTNSLTQVGRWLLIFSVPVILCAIAVVQTSRERQAARAATQAAASEAQKLQLENQQLQEEIEALRNDPEVIERIAREELNMLRPDEIILSFPNKKSEAAAKKKDRQIAPPSPPLNRE